jgi:uncharacterized protein YfaS (alpha-2-macroglobulin family)
MCLLAMSQCKKHNKIADEFNPAFTEKIAAFTSGVISSESTIKIILADDNPHAGDANSPADEDLFKFKPAIKGQTVWLDKRTLEFRPAEKLKSGESYHVRFNLGDLVKVERSISVFEFDFSIVEQNWTVSVEGYQTHNENDLIWNRIKGSISTADVIDLELLKKYFTAKQTNNKLKFNWEPTSDRRNFAFTIDSVKREEKEGKVEISWDGSPEFSSIKGSIETIIPSLSDYKVLEVKVVHQPDQYIQIMFSDPIKKNQSLDGLIFLENGTSLEFSISGNIVKAFPAARQSGTTNLTIREGLKNILGYGLKETYTTEITFEVPKPAIRLTGKGVILPSSKGMVFPFEAVNLNAVDVKIIKIFENNIGHFLQVNKLDGSNELKRAGRMVHKEKISLGHEPANLTKWNRFYLDLSKLIEPDQGAIYRIEISFRKQYSLYPCEGNPQEEDAVTTVDNDDEMEAEISYWDSYEDYYDEYYDYDGDYDYDWDERDNPCSNSYYTQSKYVARNILASDLGIIAKIGADQNVFCAVTSLVTAEPLGGVEVTLYNYQQQSIGTGTTDNSGFATIQVKEKPFLLIAKTQNQRGYLRIDDGSSLSLGAFDVSGKTVPKGLKAFVYGERGIWRPGDTLFLSCILEDKQNLLPPNHPVVFELANPKGQLYARTTKTSGINGFYTWAVATAPDALTGNYNLKVKVGGTQFNKNLKIESIKPNRLKINLTFNAKKLSSTRNDIKGDLQVSWLHGAIGANLRSVVTVNLTTASTVFEKYPAFDFSDPAKHFEAEEQTIFDANTDGSGSASIPGKFSVERDAPGMLNANFTTRVFEKSGDFSIDRFTIPYSPYSSYVGIKTPEGDKRGMLLTDTAQWVDVVIVDENGLPVSRNDVEAYVYKLYWRNWWESSDEQLADYIGNTYNSPILNKKFAVTQGKGRFSFRINRPEWGRFYIRVVDPVSGHSTGKIVFVDWPGWAGSPLKNNSEAASMLTFTANKEKYKVGETAEIIIPASAGGNALLSIESGSRIMIHEWLKAEGKEIRHEFEITPEMTPNVYVHVTLVQPHASSENDMPMRLYGVIPIFVEDPETRLNPVIKMPETLEPLQKFAVQVSESNKKDMTYTLAIVEDGLLDLTRFKTPDAWNDFYAREALGVRTWDLYDMVIGAYGGKLSSILGIGGDEDGMKGESAEKANRFKPVVRFMGPFILKEGKTNSHLITLPNYIGSVRTMVIAGQNGAYGLAEKTVPVKKPLMVLATLPRVLGPEESVKLPVTVFAMDKLIKKVTITVKTNGLLITEQESTKTIEFEQTGEKVVEFDLKIASKTGIGKVQVIATSGKNSSTYDLELDVRAANPPVTNFVGGFVEEKNSSVMNYELPGMAGSNTAVLEVSGIPPIDAGRRLKYLIAYPHGCIEQTTSGAFAQLYLPDILELDENTKSTIDANIKAGISRIRTFQLSNGAFSYWPGESFYDSWGSTYAGHFLLEAEKKGYSVPSAVKTAWLKSQKQLARQWSLRLTKDPYHQDDLEQAYRLYTLALAGEPEMSAMNRLRESKTLSLQAKWRLAAAYALSGQATVAKELISRESIEIQPYNGLYSSYGSRERDWAMLLETMTILNDKTRGAVLTKRISEALSSKIWMSTQTTAYSLMAVAKFTKGTTTGKLQFSYKMANGKVMNVTSTKPVIQIPLPINHNDRSGSIVINNTGQGTLFTRVIMEGIPPSGEEKEFESNLTLNVSYLTTDGKSLDVSDLTQGTDFIAIVSVYNPGDFNYTDMALTQIFPPGWEINNNRIADNALSENKDVPSYQDIRDDRIYTYFDLRRGEKKTFVVKLTATYLGKYYMTGAYCEAMYDNSISALKKGQWVQVKNAGE